MLNINQLKFDEKGLITAVVQDYYTKEVLTVAYMNKESLEISMQEKKTCFFSRSRNELWRKGETSGNYQHIVTIKADCDRDALVVEVIKDGPACHLGTESCFSDFLYANEDIKDFSLHGLFYMLKGRKEEPKTGSYTSYLFEKGLDKILKKVGEECTEVIIGAKGGSKEETIFEISDLTYHVFVLMLQMGISEKDVLDELAKRHIIDNKVKQETMK
ncbi:bifunctional phosphoribosyl-AMP cyclohydrolase/phosphoribosyl-ATP diphosphatase HisIE [bacterium]|nr:bifunctional phosphoribosyl-AMP cyclohydrolase/phosphoribosyl-ATP diphosphatase HisIE [bacterium]